MRRNVVMTIENQTHTCAMDIRFHPSPGKIPCSHGGFSYGLRLIDQPNLSDMAKICFIDDDPSLLEVIGKYLGKFGHAVECLDNSRSALDQVIRHTPDLVILDLCMPQFDGCSLLETVRSYLRLQNLPVIVLTGIGDGPMIDRARAQEVSTILIKGKATMEQIEEAVRLELCRTQN